jgi:hypothetical protein
VVTWSSPDSLADTLGKGTSTVHQWYLPPAAIAGLEASTSSIPPGPQHGRALYLIQCSSCARGRRGRRGTDNDGGEESGQLPVGQSLTRSNMALFRFGHLPSCSSRAHLLLSGPLCPSRWPPWHGKWEIYVGSCMGIMPGKVS